jgi:hypothetical protein
MTELLKEHYAFSRAFNAKEIRRHAPTALGDQRTDPCGMCVILSDSKLRARQGSGWIDVQWLAIRGSHKQLGLKMMGSFRWQ